MVAFYNKGDQELYKDYQYLPQEKYRLGLNLPKTEQDVSSVTANFGIPATNAFTGDGNQNNYYAGTTGSLVSGFDQAIADRQNRLEALNMPLEQKGVRGAEIKMEGVEFPAITGVEGYPNTIINETIKGAPGVYQAGAKNTIGRRISDAFYSIPGINRPQSARDILESGYTGTGSGPGILAAILGKFDRYGSLPRADQAFISSRMGYKGPTIFGANTTGLSTDPFGINTRSAFGNYAEYTKNRAEELNKSIDDSKDRWTNADWNINKSLDAIHPEYKKTWAEMNKMNLSAQDFYNKGAEEFEKIKEEEYQNRIDKFVKNYKRPGVKEFFDKTYDGANIHGGNDTTGGDGGKTQTTTYTSGKKQGTTGSWTPGGTYDAGSTQHGSSGMTKDQHDAFRAATGGRVGLRYGGLASIL